MNNTFCIIIVKYSIKLDIILFIVYIFARQTPNQRKTNAELAQLVEQLIRPYNEQGGLGKGER